MQKGFWTAERQAAVVKAHRDIIDNGGVGRPLEILAEVRKREERNKDATKEQKQQTKNSGEQFQYLDVLAGVEPRWLQGIMRKLGLKRAEAGIRKIPGGKEEVQRQQQHEQTKQQNRQHARSRDQQEKHDDAHDQQAALRDLMPSDEHKRVSSVGTLIASRAFASPSTRFTLQQLSPRSSAKKQRSLYREFAAIESAARGLVALETPFLKAQRSVDRSADHNAVANALILVGNENDIVTAAAPALNTAHIILRTRATVAHATPSMLPLKRSQERGLAAVSPRKRLRSMSHDFNEVENAARSLVALHGFAAGSPPGSAAALLRRCNTGREANPRTKRMRQELVMIPQNSGQSQGQIATIKPLKASERMHNSP